MHIISMSNHPCAIASCPLKYIYLAFCKKKRSLVFSWFYEFSIPSEFRIWIGNWCGELLIIHFLLCAKTYLPTYPGNALVRVQRVHKPADLWDITFCTR